MKKTLVLLTGPSGIGKTSTIHSLCDSNAKDVPLFKYMRSTTTRAKRENETDTNYIFDSKENFLADIKRGNFLEWNEFLGNYYGINKNELKNLFSVSDFVATEIDPNGIMHLEEDKDKIDFTIISLALLPEDSNILKKRFLHRKTDSDKEIQSRISEFENIEKALINSLSDKGLIDKIISPIDEKTERARSVEEIAKIIRTFVLEFTAKMD